MLHQSVKAQGFRVLNEDEIGAVCGGMDEFQERDIEVYGGGSDRGFGGGSSSGWMFDGGGSTQFGSGFGTARYNWAFMSALDDVTTPDANATPAQPPQQPAGADPADADKNGTVSINEAKEYNRLHPGSNTQPSPVCTVIQVEQAYGAGLVVLGGALAVGGVVTGPGEVVMAPAGTLIGGMGAVWEGVAFAAAWYSGCW
jgi:hypothetical protein